MFSYQELVARAQSGSGNVAESKSVDSFLKERGLGHLTPTRSAMTLEELVERLNDSRPKVLEALRSLGIEQLVDRQRVANVLSRALRDGVVHDPKEAERDAA